MDVHCNFPLGRAHDAEGQARPARASENEQAEQSKGNERETLLATGNGDSGMSWGRAGSTETTSERGAPAAGSNPCSGIDPQNVSQVSPMPSDLGRPLTPVSGSGSQGNLNAAGIFEATRIG